MEILGERKNLRVIRIGNIERLQTFVGQRTVDFKSLIDGGIIAQWSFVPDARGRDRLQLAECEFKGKAYRIDREPPTERSMTTWSSAGWLSPESLQIR